MATICAWADDCIPDDPTGATLAVVMLAALLVLILNDYIGGDEP